jgi:hypothetical protein
VVMEGLQRHFSRVSLQAFLCACPILIACEASASPRAKSNKKSAVTPSPCCHGEWPTAPSVDSVQVVYKYQRPSVVYSLLCAESDIRPSSLAYSLSADVVKFFFIFLCYLLEGQ